MGPGIGRTPPAPSGKVRVGPGGSREAPPGPGNRLVGGGGGGGAAVAAPIRSPPRGPRGPSNSPFRRPCACASSAAANASRPQAITAPRGHRAVTRATLPRSTTCTSSLRCRFNLARRPGRRSACNDDSQTGATMLTPVTRRCWCVSNDFLVTGSLRQARCAVEPPASRCSGAPDQEGNRSTTAGRRRAAGPARRC